MQPRITSRKQLLSLPWPEEVPTLVEEDVDGYTETLGRNRRHLWEWLKVTFDDTHLRDQFLYILHDVMVENCDPRDRDRICPSAVPTTPGYQITRAPYSASEVAEWWNEALRRVGYDA